jgi:hypothetical protein
MQMFVLDLFEEGTLVALINSRLLRSNQMVQQNKHITYVASRLSVSKPYTVVLPIVIFVNRCYHHVYGSVIKCQSPNRVTDCIKS